MVFKRLFSVEGAAYQAAVDYLPSLYFAMTLSILPKKTKAVLIGMGAFPKDESLEPIPHVAANIDELSKAMMNKDIIGLNDSDIIRLIDIKDNTRIKEELALAAEQAKEALIIYLSGYVISRKGSLYLASGGSSRDKIHLNGISFDEIMNILEEAGAPSKILLLDVCFLDAQEEEANADAIQEALRAYDSNNESLFLISTAPNMNKEAFFGYKEITIFSQALVEVLHKGTPIESNKLTLADVCEGINKYLEGMGVNMPCFSSEQVEGKEVVFAHNTRYSTYMDLRKEGNDFFEKEAYQEALKTYKKAAELLPGNEEVEQKRKFIRLLLKGMAASGENEYEKAKEAFLKAHDIMSTPTVKNKIVDTYLLIGNQQHALEKYELAKASYKQVLTWDDTHQYAKDRYKECEHELQFLDWMEEADRLYFDDKFHEAYDFYSKALTVHPDRKAQHRKLECERLIQKEKELRKQLTEELAVEISEEASKADEEALAKEREKLEQEIEERLRISLTASLTEELRPMIESMLRPQITEELQGKMREEMMKEVQTDAVAQAKKELAAEKAKDEETQKEWLKKAKLDFEEDFWTNCLLTNQIEVYRFYLQFFPRPKYTEKAKARIEDLKKQQEQQEAKAKEAMVKEAQAKAAANPPKEEPKAEAKKPVESPEKEEKTTEEGPVTHKKEEPGDKDAQNILEELEAQFNNQPAKETKIPPKTESAKESSTEEVLKGIKKTLSPPTPPVPPTPPTPEKEYSEEELWEKASKENSLEGYRFYVDNTKDSTHLVDAYYQINQLTKRDHEEEEVKEEKPVSNGHSNGKSAAHKYSVDVNPASFTPSEEVEVSKEEPQTPSAPSNTEEALWNQASKLNTVKGYYEYISQSKEKSYLKEAKIRIQDLKANAKQSESTDWEEALATNTVEAFKDYIRKYPLGDYYAKAMYCISELEGQK